MPLSWLHLIPYDQNKCNRVSIRMTSIEWKVLTCDRKKKVLIYIDCCPNMILSCCRNVNSKRTDYLDWSEYFMATAFLAAKRSKDPVTQVGACIVNDEKRIVGVGYNGMPTGCNDDEFPWQKDTEDSLNTKYLYGNYLSISLLTLF